MRGPHRNEPYGSLRVVINHRWENSAPDRLEFPRQAVHIVDVIVFTLGIRGVLVMATPASEIRRRHMRSSGQSTITNAVAIHILVSAEATQSIQVLCRE